MSEPRRGYFCVALDDPKNPCNLGGVLRAAGCYGAHIVYTTGARIRRWPQDTQAAYRHLPVLGIADPFEAMPHDCTPVAVDLVEGATPLHRFVHPERACYFFGPEDGTVSERFLKRCRSRVYIPTRRCMNLAACVNVVLYDRCLKGDSWPAPIPSRSR